MFESTQECEFCQPGSLNVLYGAVNDVSDTQSPRMHSFQVRMNSTLYNKYSSSQNYHYTRDVNEILGNVRSQSNIKYNDLFCFDDVDEYLKRFYQQSEYEGTVALLSEFYKFHKDLPRWTISKEILSILNHFYDKKRKIEFFKIQKMIENENKNNPNQPAKGIIGERPYETESTPPSDVSDTVNINPNVDNILQEITFQQSLLNSQISFIKERNSYVQFDTEELLLNVPKGFSVQKTKQTLNTEVNNVNFISVQQSTVSRTEVDIVDTQNSRLKTDRGSQIVVQPRIFEKEKFFKKDIYSSKNTSYSLPNSLNLKSLMHSTLKSSQQNTIIAKQTPKNPISKKKIMQKKILKLDEAALSQSLRNRPEDRIAQTARSSKPFNILLLDQIMSSKLGQQSSLTTSRKRLQQKELSKDKIQKIPKVKKTFFPYRSQKPVKQPLHKTFDQDHKQSQKENSYMKEIQKIPSQHTPKPLLTQKNQYKRTFNQLLIPTEVKKLELKVMQGLQDIQKRNHVTQQKKFSFDQKSLNQILLNCQRKQSEKYSLSQGKSNSSLGICNSYSQYDSQNFSHQPQKSTTPRSIQAILRNQGPQVKVSTSISPQRKQMDQNIRIAKLDFQKLESSDIYQVQTARSNSKNTLYQHKPQIQTDRCNMKENIRLTTTIKDLIIDQQQRQSIMRQEQTKKKLVISPSSGIQSRHNSLYPTTPRMLDLRAPSFSNVHNLKQWQIQAIQAASKEYNLITPRRQ